MNTLPPPDAANRVQPIPAKPERSRAWIAWLIGAVIILGAPIGAGINRIIQARDTTATDEMWQAAWDSLSTDEQFDICRVVTGQAQETGGPTRDDLITDDSSENFVEWVEDNMNNGLCAN